jgi:hypothetical protein
MNQLQDTLSSIIDLDRDIDEEHIRFAIVVINLALPRLPDIEWNDQTRNALLDLKKTLRETLDRLENRVMPSLAEIMKDD